MRSKIYYIFISTQEFLWDFNWSLFLVSVVLNTKVLRAGFFFFFFFYPDERSLLVAEIKSSSGADVSFSPPVSRLC